MRKQKFTVEQVASALKASAGFQSAAADKLGCTQASISQYIKRYKILQEVVYEQKERILDYCEKRLIDKINDGDLTAIIFFLKTQGKMRGYTEKKEIEIDKFPEIPIFIPRR